MLVCVFVTIDTLSLPHKNPIIVRYSVFFCCCLVCWLVCLLCLSYTVPFSLFVKCGFYYFVCWRFVMCIWLALHVHVYQILFCKCLSNTSLSFWYPHLYIYMFVYSSMVYGCMNEFVCSCSFQVYLLPVQKHSHHFSFEVEVEDEHSDLVCILFIFSLFSYSLFFILILIYLFFLVLSSFLLLFYHSSWFWLESTRIHIHTQNVEEVTGKKQTKHKRHIIKALHDNEQFHNI